MICHEANTTVNATAPAIDRDFYGQFVQLCATFREVVYSHARRLDELGPSTITGRKPWYAWLILGLVCVLLRVGLLVFTQRKGATLQACPPPSSASTLTQGFPGSTNCVNVTSSPLSTSYASILLLSALALVSGIEAESGSGGNQQTVLLTVQV